MQVCSAVQHFLQGSSPRGVATAWSGGTGWVQDRCVQARFYRYFADLKTIAEQD